MATVVGMFDRTADADATLDRLMSLGFSKKQIGVVARHDVARAGGLNTSGGMEVGAITGATSGGIAGLLIGLGAIVIPGIGPIVAAGEFLTFVGATVLGLAAGAIGGGLIGALTGFGVSETQAQRFSEGVKAGHILLTVQAGPDQTGAVVDEMRNQNAVEVDVGENEIAAPVPMASMTSDQQPMAH